jgi:hypothetical protein
MGEAKNPRASATNRSFTAGPSSYRLVRDPQIGKGGGRPGAPWASRPGHEPQRFVTATIAAVDASGSCPLEGGQIEVFFSSTEQGNDE